MKRLTFAVLLTVVLMLGLLFTPTVGYADGPTVKVTQVDPSAFPRVAVYVSVTDEAGQPIGALKQEDFDLREDGQPVEILEFAGIGSDRPVDVVFVFDTTGSMDDEIEGVKNTSIAFANKLRDSNRDFRLGLVAFGDEIRSVDNQDGLLTADAEEFKRWVGRLRADGGGDDEEMSLDALLEGSRMRFRPDAQKILLLITDAPPHERGDGTRISRVTAGETATTLKDAGFTVYAVAYSDGRFRQIVDATGGGFYDIQRERDFTGIIDKIGGLIASQYRIAYESHRPAFDGTRRPVTVTVGGSTGTKPYTEQHMLNVNSTPVAALLMTVPLLAALLFPVVWPRIRRRQMPIAPSSFSPSHESGNPSSPPPFFQERQKAPQAYSPPASGPIQRMPAGVPVSADGVSCPYCGNTAKAGAKFCATCGQPVQTKPALLQQATCPNCRHSLRPGAQFCGNCGFRISS